MVRESYGQELILDLHECDASTFTRKSIKRFFISLCLAIEMERGPLYWWDDKWALPWQRETEPHLKGTTAIQFIRTSNMTIHTLDMQKAVRLNVFSCKSFDAGTVKRLAVLRFRGQIVSEHNVTRY